MPPEVGSHQEPVTFKSLYEGLMPLLNTSLMVDSIRIKNDENILRLIHENNGSGSSITGYKYPAREGGNNREIVMFRITRVVDQLSPGEYLFSPRFSIITNADSREITDPVEMRLIITEFTRGVRLALAT